MHERFVRISEGKPMTGSATQPGQDTSQPAGDTGAAAAAGDQQSTVLGGDTQQQQAPADGKAKDEGKKADVDAKQDDKGTQQQSKAPEKYADFKIPDGMAVDAKALEAFTPALRELNLTQDQAQKLVDVYATNVK